MNNMEKNVKKRNIIIKLIITVGCFLAAVKILHTGFSADEEYQLVLGYRIANGDRLFGEIWDTIQTSGFLTAGFLRLYMSITGSAVGSLLFVRLCGILIQAVTALLLYSTLRTVISENAAFVVGAFVFATFTKMIAMPDFSNMQMWFATIMICTLWKSCEYENGQNVRYQRIYLAVSAFMACLMVLSTACVIAVIPVILFLWMKDKPGRKRRLGWFVGTCCFVAVIYLAIVLKKVGFADFTENIGNILSGDRTHGSGVNILGENKLLANLVGALKILGYMVASALLAYGIGKLVKYKKKEVNLLCVTGGVWIIISALFTLAEWTIFNKGFDGFKLYIPVIVAVGSTAAVVTLKKISADLATKSSEDENPTQVVKGKNAARKRRAEERCNQQTNQKLKLALQLMLTGICVGFLAFINVLVISNVPIINNLAFLLPAVSWALAACVVRVEYMPSGSEIKYANALWIFVTLLAIFATGYTMTSGGAGNNVLSVSGIIRSGPAKGVITSRDVAYTYYTDYNEFESVVEPGTNVLMVTDFFQNTSVTSCMMLNNVNISHYSVNSTPTYSDKLYKYWSKYPKKEPDVIVVNKSVVTIGGNDFITEYINGDFAPREIIHGELLDYYIR